jgi:hypothetical protein
MASRELAGDQGAGSEIKVAEVSEVSEVSEVEILWRAPLS